MWGKQNVFHLVEGMVGRQRLLIEDVQGGASDLMRRERMDHCRFVDDRAAADVDHDGGILHGCEFARADQAARFGVQRRGYEDVVTARHHLKEPSWTVN